MPDGSDAARYTVKKIKNKNDISSQIKTYYKIMLSQIVCHIK